ncbi:armadillo-like helical domain-containing protein 3 isoform X2 [Artemia franciscana]|uniref:Armadillo-like helical domain-containing protein n=2 Tax=Artemia franciscana TaxID=6661 RepID=A0AA88LDB1_ARTSF|nr:hypothetical protein QYM36_007907 [Artemia franciscana]
MSKRHPSGTIKKAFKEKVVAIYETIFRGEDPSAGNPNFWDEFFLLKPKVSCFEVELLKLSADQLEANKININLLFTKCLEMLKAEQNIKIVYALQTMGALTRILYQKHCADPNFDLIGVLVGSNDVDRTMEDLIKSLSELICADFPCITKKLVLKFLLVIVTGFENISSNVLLDHFMINSMFDPLIQLLSLPESRSQFGRDVVLLNTLLITYKKQEAANPYLVKLSLVDDELVLHGYAQVISSGLQEFCRKYIVVKQQEPQNSWLSSITSMVGNMFVSEEAHNKMEKLKANDSLLLALYEAVHSSRNFVTVFAYIQPHERPPQPPSDEEIEADHQDDSIGAPATPTPTVENVTHSSSLLATLLEYCSVIMQDVKHDVSLTSTKLSFIVLTVVTEDNYANSLMHDPNLVFQVQIHKAVMRHRKIGGDPVVPARPIVSALLDLVIEFIVTHLLKKFPVDLYELALGIIVRLICYQKRCKVRINYQWRDLWHALFSLLKFLQSAEGQLLKKLNIFPVAQQAINIFNLFITYGDTFLSVESLYDDLYYEIIRNKSVFDNIYSMVLRYSSSEGDNKEYSLRLMTSLNNIRSIIGHFTPKVDTWLATQSLSTPTEAQILEVVRNGYESLTLKLVDNLDQFQRYTETPNHNAFFAAFIRNVIVEARAYIDLDSIDHQSLLNEPCVTPT